MKLNLQTVDSFHILSALLLIKNTTHHYLFTISYLYLKCPGEKSVFIKTSWQLQAFLLCKKSLPESLSHTSNFMRVTVTAFLKHNQICKMFILLLLGEKTQVANSQVVMIRRRLSSQIARLSKFQTAIRGFYVNSQNRFQVRRELKRLLFVWETSIWRGTNTL